MAVYTPTQLARYRQSAERREAQNAPLEAERRQTAWEVAATVAARLRSEFAVTRVVVFGSLARESGFTQWSDIDIAVWGLRLEDTFRALGVAWDLSDQFKINLVDVNCCKESWLAEIEKTGIELNG